MKEPFGAVVGVENAGQYRELLAADGIREGVGQLAVGVLMSEKTGLLGEPNRHGRIYPTFEEAGAIVREHDDAGDDALPIIIHYNTDNTHLAGEQLLRALSPYEFIEGVQINGLRPEHLPSLARFKERRPGTRLILQIDSELLKKMRPDEMADLAAHHVQAIDYLWLDGSGGEGRPLDKKKLLPIIERVKKTAKGVKIGVAGGLSPDNLEELLTPILNEFPDISWDAQSGVQLKINRQRRFDVDAAVNFYAASLALREQFPLTS